MAQNEDQKFYLLLLSKTSDVNRLGYLFQCFIERDVPELFAYAFAISFNMGIATDVINKFGRSELLFHLKKLARKTGESSPWNVWQYWIDKETVSQ